MPDSITVRGARLHNLKNLTVSIPKNKLVVLTGLSGSGKSTLGFDILHREGQRQYIEALGLAPFGLARLPVELDQRAVALDQHRPASDQPQPALNCRHCHRRLHLPAGAVRPSGPAPLSELRHGGPPGIRPAD